MNDNKYKTVYSKNDIQILAKIKSYFSVTSSQEYDVVTDVKILKNKECMYEARYIHIPYNRKGYTSLVDYVEKIAAYINDNFDKYWGGLFLDKFFIESKTTPLNLFYINYIHYKKEQKEKQKYKEKDKQIQQLKQQLYHTYNDKGYAVIEHVEDLYIFNNIIYKNKNWSLIDNQKNTYLTKDIISNIEKYKNICVGKINLGDTTAIKKLNEAINKTKNMENGSIFLE